MRFWEAHPQQERVAVLQGERPVGLVSRTAFMEAWARPFQRELFGRRHCTLWMDGSPLTVEESVPVDALFQRALRAGGAALREGFVVTRGGGYAGVGSGSALLDAAAELDQLRTTRLLESIRYASILQRANLAASDRALAAGLPEHALLWSPREAVGGDCYFFRRLSGGLFGAVLDCTGHGVPGAFMTLIALSILERAIPDGAAFADPAAALQALHVGIRRMLDQESGPEGLAGPASDDGLDGVCFLLPEGGGEIAFAAARLGMLVAPPGQDVVAVEADRFSIGYRDTERDRRWTTRRVPLPPGSIVVVATDGVTDQVGGPRGIAFGRRRLAEAVRAAQERGPAAVRDGVAEALEAWQGAEPRRDDVTVLAFRRGRQA